MIEVRPLDPGDGTTLERLPFSRLGQPGGEYLVAWLDGDPVGHAHVAWQPDPPELQDVFVPEGLRRRGIASALADAAEERARRRGYAELALEVGEGNDAARSLYLARGYRPTGRLRRVKGTIVLRTGPFDVDDTLETLVKPL